MTKLFKLAACSAALISSTSAFATTSLIGNGSFEADAQAAGTWHTYSNLTGWKGGDYGTEVLWNGQQVALEKAGGIANTANAWTVYTFNVVGSQHDQSKLEFKAVGTSDSYGGALDAVSLTSAVPEPETYAMIAVGLGLVGFASRRKYTPLFTV